MAKRHWEPSDFVKVRATLGFARYGYCRKCGADMQAFASDGYKLRHYNSHKYYKVAR